MKKGDLWVCDIDYDFQLIIDDTPVEEGFDYDCDDELRNTVLYKGLFVSSTDRTESSIFLMRFPLSWKRQLV
jgi:hypothetical protein